MKVFLLLAMLAGPVLGWDLALRYVHSGGPVPDERRILVLARQILLRQVTEPDTGGVETDTAYREARLGFWAHRRLRKLASDPRLETLRYSPADTGIFCEGGITLDLRAARGVIAQRETCRLEKSIADSTLNALRGRIREALDQALERGRPATRRDFEAAASEIRRRLEDPEEGIGAAGATGS